MGCAGGPRWRRVPVAISIDASFPIQKAQECTLLIHSQISVCAHPSPPTLPQGFPGSIASLWQQAGRAGRREQASLAIVVAFDGPLDQHFVRHPDELLGRPIEAVQVCCTAGWSIGRCTGAEQEAGRGWKTRCLTHTDVLVSPSHPSNARSTPATRGCCGSTWRAPLRSCRCCRWRMAPCLVRRSWRRRAAIWSLQVSCPHTRARSAALACSRPAPTLAPSQRPLG
jgi:hypothetical protein